MATLRDNLQKAWEEENIINLKRIVNLLRYKGYRYHEVFDAVRRATGKRISLAEFDERMRELDEAYTPGVL